MKFKKINMIAIFPFLISQALADSGDLYYHHGMMDSGWGVFGIFFMGLFTVLIIMAILWLAKEIGKK